jgi:hypothetical protein
VGLMQGAFIHREQPALYSGRMLSDLRSTSRLQRRREGVRIKHWADGNSVKMYDKAGSVLRVETTVAKTMGFKVFRPVERPRCRTSKLEWRPLRKGIADLHRRAQVSQRSNQAYRRCARRSRHGER